MASKSISRRATRLLSSAKPTSVVALAGRCTYIPPSRTIHHNTQPTRPRLQTGPRSPFFSSRRTIFIQTEETPNPDALKFKPNQRILPENLPTPFLEYLSPAATLKPPHPSPLAGQLLNVDGVTAVFFGQDYITVTKDSATQWAHVKPEVFALITEAITSGTPIVNSPAGRGEQQDGAEDEVEKDSLAYDENDSEVVGMIKELLETRIRPAIQDDGGDIEFRGFDNGQVLLKLRGACRTCDSSTVTLRNGIESMMMHYIPEVQGVQQVMDEEEEIAMKEFQRFEERLRMQGREPPPTSPGKGSLDTIA